MKWGRARALGRELRRPGTWVRLGKIGVFLGAEVALAPAAILAAAALSDGDAAERLLSVQNQLRRWAVWWILPEFRPEFRPER